MHVVHYQSPNSRIRFKFLVAEISLPHVAFGIPAVTHPLVPDALNLRFAQVAQQVEDAVTIRFNGVEINVLVWIESI
jgi:hypothetical protein